ncbi:MAG: hypothetical protein ACYDCP_08505 [Thermoplasmataceae archaeon]
MINGRMKILIVLAIAVIIPSVAVADVMITGTVNVQGSQTSDVFVFTPGSNAPQAGGFISMSPTSSAPYMADIDLENNVSMSVFTINVLQVNFKSAPGTFTLNVSISTPFPGDSIMYYSTSPMALSDFSGTTPSSITSTAPIPTAASGIYELNIHSKASQTGVPLTISSTLTHVYIGFYVSGGGNSGEFVLTGSFVST